MSTERLIVVGVDGSSGSRQALAWALEHARSTGATVQVVTAYSWHADWTYAAGGPEDQTQRATALQDQEIELVLRGYGNPPELSRLVAEGSPVDVLTHAAEGADMLVLGSHGHGHLATALLGSVSAACVRHGSTPVLVVPTVRPTEHADVLIPAPQSATR
jgi:nucleotide-binding universal stress UspA family protein